VVEEVVVAEVVALSYYFWVVAVAMLQAASK